MKKIIVVSFVVLITTMGWVSAQVAQVIKINQKEFVEKVIDYTSQDLKYLGKVPAIVDFYAEWCRPCKMLAPTLEELAAEYGGKIIIYKVNVDEEKAMSQALGIRSMPTLYFFPVDGEPTYTIGLRSKEELKEIISTELRP